MIVRPGDPLDELSADAIRRYVVDLAELAKRAVGAPTSVTELVKFLVGRLPLNLFPSSVRAWNHARTLASLSAAYARPLRELLADANKITSSMPLVDPGAPRRVLALGGPVRSGNGLVHVASPWTRATTICGRRCGEAEHALEPTCLECNTLAPKLERTIRAWQRTIEEWSGGAMPSTAAAVVVSVAANPEKARA